MIDLALAKQHIRRQYMVGLDRDQGRVRSMGEVFTPTELVIQYVDWLEQYDAQSFSLPENTFCDNSCGDGQFLGEILIRKMERGIEFATALASIYGVDYQISNVDICRDRLMCGSQDPNHRAIVENNIVCADALTYKYTFPPMSEGRRRKEAVARRKELKDKLDRQQKEKERIKQQFALKMREKFFGESLIK